jgi:hypothetical protein
VARPPKHGPGMVKGDIALLLRVLGRAETDPGLTAEQRKSLILHLKSATAILLGTAATDTGET